MNGTIEVARTYIAVIKMQPVPSDLKPRSREKREWALREAGRAAESASELIRELGARDVRPNEIGTVSFLAAPEVLKSILLLDCVQGVMNDQVIDICS